MPKGLAQPRRWKRTRGTQHLIIYRLRVGRPPNATGCATACRRTRRSLESLVQSCWDFSNRSRRLPIPHASISVPLCSTRPRRTVTVSVTSGSMLPSRHTSHGIPTGVSRVCYELIDVVNSGYDQKTIPERCDGRRMGVCGTLLDSDAQRCSQREYVLREVFNGVCWIVRTASPWRMMPHDLPPGPCRINNPNIGSWQASLKPSCMTCVPCYAWRKGDTSNRRQPFLMGELSRPPQRVVNGRRWTQA